MFPYYFEKPFCTTPKEKKILLKPPTHFAFFKNNKLINLKNLKNKNCRLLIQRNTW